MAGTSNRGFASMDSDKQREIASKGGKAAHKLGTAHQFTPDEARVAGRKGGEAVSQNRQHMSNIGRLGGEASRQARQAGRTSGNKDQQANLGSRAEGREDMGGESRGSEQRFQGGGENRGEGFSGTL